MPMLNNIELSPGVGFFKHNGKVVIFRASSVSHDSRLVEYIDIMKQTGVRETLIIFKIPKFFAYEEKQVRVNLPLHDVVRILNHY